MYQYTFPKFLQCVATLYRATSARIMILKPPTETEMYSHHNPYKSMKQFAAVKTNRHLPNAEANGKQGEPFFSGYAVHDVCPYQKLFAREHLDKNCRFLGFSQASTEIRKCLTRESLQKPLYYIHGFSKPMFKSV